MMDPRSPKGGTFGKILDFHLGKDLAVFTHRPSVSDRHPESARFRMEPASYVRMGRMASGRPRRKRRSPPEDQACVAEPRSSDTPGPMVELIETFLT